MKIFVQFIALWVVASVVTARVTPRNKFEEGLLKVIEKCQKGDVKSLPIALPSLNPLMIAPINLQIEGYSVSISETRVKGLEYMSVEKLTASPEKMTLSMELSIPTLAIRADRYHLEGMAFIIPINDQGILKSHVSNLRVRTDIQFGAKGKDTVVTDHKLDYSFEIIEIELSDSNFIVNRVVNYKIPELINSSDMKSKLQNFIKDMVSEYLRGHTPQEFVEIISRM